MAGLFERRKSKLARWCYRLAVLAVPLLLLTVLFHRSDLISTVQMFWLFAFVIAILLLSLLFGGFAANELWKRGDEGGRTSIKGIVLALILLCPFGVQLLKAINHPQLNDVATDVLAMPHFIDPPINGDTDDGNYDDYVAELIVSRYPQLVGRRYEGSPERILEAVREVLEIWRVGDVKTRFPPGFFEEGQNENQNENNVELEGGNNADNSTEQDNAPGSDDEIELLLQFEQVGFILKLRHLIAIRLVEIDNVTQVDLRAASDWGPHDFGRNAALIEAFLADLDESLAGLAGEI